MHRRSASVGGEVSAVKRAQNAAAKAAAARLAQVMASSQGAGDDDGETGGGDLTARLGPRYGVPPLPSRTNGSVCLLSHFLIPVLLLFIFLQKLLPL